MSIAVFFILVFNQFQKRRFKEKQEFKIEIKNKELEMLNAVVQAQENERMKIARNLHDEVGAILSMAQQNLGVALKRIPEESPFREDVEFTLDVLDQSVGKIRSISHGMLPHFLIKFGLKKTLSRLISQTHKTLGNSCTFSCSIDNHLDLEQHSEIQFYSITLELLNNILKHAKPQSVNLFLYIMNSNLVLKFEHDGVGISQTDYEYLLNNGKGLGLESVAYRLKLIKGKIQYQRHSIGGTIELSMPKQNNSNEKIILS
jgi:signal transduction histidine kinase